jgi:hypothetical protein
MTGHFLGVEGEAAMRKIIFVPEIDWQAHRRFSLYINTLYCHPER